MADNSRECGVWEVCDRCFDGLCPLCHGNGVWSSPHDVPQVLLLNWQASGVAIMYPLACPTCTGCGLCFACKGEGTYFTADILHERH